MKEKNVKVLGKKAEKTALLEFNLDDWLKVMCGRITTELEKKKRIVVSLAGASASGKSEAAELLQRELEAQKIKTIAISTDNFYKGVSRLVAENLPQHLGRSDLSVDKLEFFIKNLTAQSKFTDKFTPENLMLIRNYLAAQQPEINIDAAMAAISHEINHLDFDRPEAVDLTRAGRVIHELKAGKKTIVPEYSMETSESSGERELDASAAQVILVEGIYGLNRSITADSDIKSFIEADPKTLLMRRMRRDVLAGRSTFSPEMNLWIILETVLPAYYEHILPTRDQADFVLKNEFTEAEALDTKQYDVQDKLSVTPEDIRRLKKLVGKPQAVVVQEDYYFSSEVKGHDPRHLLRLRIENGALKSLLHKGAKIERDDGKIVRPTEKYVKSGEFGARYSGSEELVSAFRRAGFSLVAQLSKQRSVYELDDIEITLDSVDGLGDFVELRCDNRLSRAPEIDKFKTRIGWDDRRSAGPYIDEFLARVATDPEAWRQQEALLNLEITRENVLTEKLCYFPAETTDIKRAYGILRRGYPDLPLSKQAKGEEFRQAGLEITTALAKKTLSVIDHNHAVVLMPWRSGLAFARSYQQAGVNNFYHLSSKRDEATLATIVDYENGRVDGESVVIIADPMLATGNTIVDAIERMIAQGVREENIIVNSVVAAPSGVARVKKAFPRSIIIVGALDDKLDYKGYIVPGLGDFGDKYFAQFSPEDIKNMTAMFNLNAEAKTKMIARIKQQGVSEVLSDLIERDLKDQEIDEQNRQQLLARSIKRIQPGKRIKVDTGRTQGVENVTAVITGVLGSTDRIVAIEGMSGTGKSATAETLRERMHGVKFSMGEVFRYLAYRHWQDEGFDIIQATEVLAYRLIEDQLQLFDGEINISASLAKELHLPEVEAIIPSVSVQCQAEVIALVGRELAALSRQTGPLIIIEGRGFTLDYLPADVRVKLTAEPVIRAERRWEQKQK